MGLMDELKRLARPYSEDEDDFEEELEEDEEVEETEEEEPVEEAPRSILRREAPAAAPKAAPKPAPARAAAPVVSGLRSNASLQMILVKPERYEEVSEVADHLRNKNAVVLNLEATDHATAKRLVDFLSGCAYALEGNIRKVATSTYVITPYNVDLVGELSAEDIENNAITY